jgi:hypothetical protein
MAHDRSTRKLAHADPEADGKARQCGCVGKTVPPTRTPGAGDEMPPEYWQAVLDDPRADDAGPRPTGPSIRTQRLSDIQRHLLRVACRRCGRTVEIQKADAVRLAGPQAVWKDVGQRLLDNTCRQRTGRHEEDGCWPSFE